MLCTHSFSYVSELNRYHQTPKGYPVQSVFNNECYKITLTDLSCTYLDQFETYHQQKEKEEAEEEEEEEEEGGGGG